MSTFKTVGQANRADFDLADLAKRIRELEMHNACLEAENEQLKVRRQARGPGVYAASLVSYVTKQGRGSTKERKPHLFLSIEHGSRRVMVRLDNDSEVWTEAAAESLAKIQELVVGVTTPEVGATVERLS